MPTQQQTITECTIEFDPRKRKEYYVGKLSCGCPFRKLAPAGSKPPMRGACDHHPVRVEVEQCPDPTLVQPTIVTSEKPVTNMTTASPVVSNLSAIPEYTTITPIGGEASGKIVIPSTKIPGHEPEFVPVLSAEKFIAMSNNEAIVVPFVHPAFRFEAEASVRLDGDTICVPPITHSQATSTIVEVGESINSGPIAIELESPKPAAVSPYYAGRNGQPKPVLDSAALNRAFEAEHKRRTGK